ncbi:MAG: hypothetical protein Kow0022_10910 [Phycisphaerales bacterium]
MGLTFYTMLPVLIWLLFAIAYGACVGSLINVLVYRLPRGLGVVRPASRCPKCGHRLTFRENIPILGWILLRGRCRFCQQRISPEYPLVEAVVAFLFALIYFLYFGLPELGHSSALAMFQPEWALNGLARTWPELVVLLLLVGSLTAVTLIDARTAQIPLILVWTPALIGLVFHVGHAAFVQIRHGNPKIPLPGLGWRLADGQRWMAAPGHIWSIPTAGTQDWWFVGLAVGGTVGLGIAVLLLESGVIRRSFADYAEWEAQAIGAARADAASGSSDAAARPQSNAATDGPDAQGAPSRDAPSERIGSADDAELWIQYPHARREMLKEIAFVAMPVACAAAGMWLAPWLVARFWGPWRQPDPYALRLVPPVDVPLWLSVLSGVLAGYLIGGGVVWAIRILGSLAFGKEALGLGDVHLVAAIGACLGYVDAVLGFFGAAFVGLAWTVAAGLFSGRVDRTLPYGPYIAVATLLVQLGKPGIEWLLTRLSGVAVNLP